MKRSEYSRFIFSQALLFCLLCNGLFSGKVYSQIFPPGGIGNSSNIVMWLSPDTALYNNSGNVAINGEDIFQWHDISNNNVVFTNTNATRRPVLSTFNGQNFLDFTPGDFLENAGISSLINGLNEFSIFVVVKSDVTNTDNGFLDSENPDDADDKICLRYDVDGANTGRVNVIKAGLQGNTPNNQIETTSNVQTTNIQVLAITWKNGERLKSYINGVANELSPNNVTGPISNVSKIIVGKGPKDGGAAEGWDGKVGTVIFYNHQFPADTIAVISNSALFTAGIIGTNQTICSGTAPSAITNVSSPTGGTGSYTYQWQSSPDNSVWSTIGGATSDTYSPGSLSSSTYFRRIVISGSETKITSPVLITVNPSLPASVSISSTATSFCSGTSVAFTASPVNGGGAPSYQWRRTRGGVTSNVSTVNPYTTTTHQNGDIVFCVMTSNATCVTGSPATSGSVVLTVIAGGGSWSGITSNNWNTNSNWCSGARPTAATNVAINGGTFNDPLISTSNAVCNNLTLNSGSVLTVNGRTLNISGNLVINSGASLVITNNTVTVNGSITVNPGGSLSIASAAALSARGNLINNGVISGDGTLTLNGSAVQNISGSGSYGNLTLNNGLGCVASTAVTITGTLTLTSGAFTSNGNLSIDLNTGSIAGTGVGSIVGNITVFKTASSARYHYLSSPLAGTNVMQWHDDVEIKVAQYRNLFYYDETVPSPVDLDGWTPINGLGLPLQVMKGYALFFGGPTTIDMTGAYVHSAVPGNVTLTNTVSSDINSDGWNLVGNPYPSTLDWDAGSGWTKTGIDDAIYFWDPVNNRYASYINGAGTNGGTQYIPSMQAFWVHVTASGGSSSFGMNNNVRTTATNPALWRTASAENMLKLTAGSGGYSDEAIIRLREDAQDSFDAHADAYKLANEENTPNLYSEMGGNRYAINSLSDNFQEKTIPIKLKAGFTGSYTFTAEQMGTFNNGYELFFIDSLNGISQNILTDPTYTTEITQGDTSARFYLTFKKAAVNPIISITDVPPSMFLRAAENNVYIRFMHEKNTTASILINNSIGQVKYYEENVDISSGEVSIQLPEGEQGIYIVKVTTDSQSHAGKVYLSR